MTVLTLWKKVLHNLVLWLVVILFSLVAVYAQDDSSIYDEYYNYTNSNDNYDFGSNFSSSSLLSLDDWGISLLSVLWWFFKRVFIIITIILNIFVPLFYVSFWEIYRKAGKKNWSFIVPVWGTMVYSEIAWMNKWLWFVPWVWVLCSFFVWKSNPLWAFSLFVIRLDIAVMLWALLWLVIANYRIARRFWRWVFASILNALIIFIPITTLVLWLWKCQYLWESENLE